jgi:hypothetical protein
MFIAEPRSRIHDPDFFPPWISDHGSRDPDFLPPILDHGSRIQGSKKRWIPDPRSRIQIRNIPTLSTDKLIEADRKRGTFKRTR